jgi:hypothetical protein
MQTVHNTQDGQAVMLPRAHKKRFFAEYRDEWSRVMNGAVVPAVRVFVWRC